MRIISARKCNSLWTTEKWLLPPTLDDIVPLDLQIRAVWWIVGTKCGRESALSSREMAVRGFRKMECFAIAPTRRQYKKHGLRLIPTFPSLPSVIKRNWCWSFFSRNGYCKLLRSVFVKLPYLTNEKIIDKQLNSLYRNSSAMFDDVRV